ncbi:N-acetyltransferase [Allorhodopirellula solitaria]|uniref:N-acetyltransferase domain-containing protein n=1 Tax=Allorhodopirellula solitaria TaxID=2527987 RepID=A0A5C5XY60_9BACT|nr:N-acetyltransferase [Allorhodopirellula solitaria]TWT67461.1 hypothetical protein CA85_23120 [Allorhodopirellula solitaria]
MANKATARAFADVPQSRPAVTTRPVRTRRDLKDFLNVPWSIYGDDPQWVPPLHAEIRSRLNPKKNPYFEHANAALFLAERGGRVVGRISAQICQLAQRHHGTGDGHFGFFECDDSSQTSDALFNAAETWLAERSMSRMVGPFNLSIHEEAGLLIDGFHRPPFVFMTHNPPYYQRLFDEAGMRREMDVYAYYLDITLPYQERIARILKAAGRNSKISLRNVDKGNLKAELGLLLELFNESWAENWGHLPMTQGEVDELAMLVRRLFSTDAVVLAEIDGKVAGFMVVIPNLNELTADLNGKLFPFGWLRMFYRIQRKSCRSVRVPLMGIAKEYQNTRTGAAIAFSMIDRCRTASVRRGATHCEMSWILETNTAMRSILDASGSTLDKTYRLYSKSLADVDRPDE